MKIAFFGSCHIHGVVSCLEVVLNKSKYELLKINPKLSYELSVYEIDFIREADIIAVVSTFRDQFIAIAQANGLNVEDKIQLLPHVRSRHLHPDLITIQDASGELITTALDKNNSALILFGYLNGLSTQETRSLFNDQVFRALGYFDVYKDSVNWFKNQEAITGYDILECERVWIGRGSYLHTPNHPSLIVFSSLALQFAKINKLEIVFDRPEALISDRAASQAIWPVYPEVANKLGMEGSYFFKAKHDPLRMTANGVNSFDLDGFIEDCYLKYKEIGLVDVKEESQYGRIFKNVSPRDLLEVSVVGVNDEIFKNPYKSLPDTSYWRRSLSSMNFEEIDPVVNVKLKINRSDKVATAGSCFAQHISKSLISSGFTWLESEKAPEDISPESAGSQGYGVFSCRYGNIYTARQLLQVFYRAFEVREFVDEPWRKGGSNKVIDPFRPYIIDDGFLNIESYRSDLKNHLSSVKKMFEDLDVFVFTLGLTEAWIRKSDGAVLPFHPGVVGGVCNGDEFEFKNFSLQEIVDDLNEFLNGLRKVNPRAKVIVTVSPVPLIATFERQHVLVATTYSKSVLRVAANEVAEIYPYVEYFPSYEIISSHCNGGGYYKDDKREVRANGVNHVMTLLLKHYTERDNLYPVSSLDQEEASVVCDESNLESGAP